MSRRFYKRALNINALSLGGLRLRRGHLRFDRDSGGVERREGTPNCEVEPVESYATVSFLKRHVRDFQTPLYTLCN